MTIDEFIQRVAGQPPVTFERNANVGGNTEEYFSITPFSLAEFVRNSRYESKTFHYGHVLGPGLSQRAIQAWQEKHVCYPMPNDLVDLLRRANGINLWADLTTGRGYLGILPLGEWQDVNATGWAVMFDRPPAASLVMSHHGNGDAFLIFDTAKQHYLWYDIGDFDNPKRIGGTVTELLDFWWQTTAFLDPRRTV